MPDALLPGAYSAAVEADLKSSLDSKSPPKHRLRYIDGLRALAAMIVIVTHAYQQIWWLITPQGGMGKVYKWFWLGRYAVVAFIVLSGFCLMRPVVLSGSLQGGAREFYKGRALRILPAYWAAMMGTLLLIGTLLGQKHNTMFDITLPVTIGGVLNHFFLVNNFFTNIGGQLQWGGSGNTQINSVFWTIALEWQIYFWFPALAWMWKRGGMYLILAVGAIVVASLHHLLPHSSWLGLNIEGLNICYYYYFILGMLAATLVFSEERARIVDIRLFGPLAAWLIVGFPLMYVVIWKGIRTGYFTIEMMDLYTALMMTAILVSGALGGLKPLSWQPLVNVGKYSYSVYLLHLPLLALLTDYIILPLRGHISRTLEFGLLLLLGFPLIVICSKRFSNVFEDKKQLTYYWDRGKHLLAHR